MGSKWVGSPQGSDAIGIWWICVDFVGIPKIAPFLGMDWIGNWIGSGPETRPDRTGLDQILE